MERRTRAIWGDAFDALYRVYVCVEEIGATTQQRHQSSQDPQMDALLGLHARMCLQLAEVQSLCTHGFPLGASARARSMHENAVVAAVLTECGREEESEDVAERFTAWAVVEQLRDMLAAKELGFEVDVEEMQAVVAARNETVTKYGPGFASPYGWARPLYPGKGSKDRITFDEISALADSALDKLDCRTASHHVPAMDAAVRDKLLATSPCGKHHRLPRLPEHEPTILTIEQVEKLVGHLRSGSPPTGKDKRSCQPIRPNPQLALVVELLAYGGLRVGEALALRRKHVDVLGCKLVVAESLTELNDVFTFGPSKTHQVREVPLPRGLLPELEHHLDHDVARTVDALVSIGVTGGPVRYRSLRRSFDAACRRVGMVGVTPHSPGFVCVVGSGE